MKPALPAERPSSFKRSNEAARKRRGLVVLLLLWTALARGMTVTQTGCRPVDAAEPPRTTANFSWMLDSHRRGEEQTAYQVEVTGLWDSGKVVSDQSVDVAYAGPPPVAGKYYEWKVRVWDKDGRPSAWSRPAGWQTGLATEDAWQAQWIGATATPSAALNSKKALAPTNGPGFAAILLRKETESRGPIRRATAFVCGLGLYELSVNGKRVSDHLLEPAFTDFDRRVLYQIYDLTPQWRSGRNAIGVMLGNGWYHLAVEDLFGNGHAAWRGAPKLRLRIEIEFANGTRQVITSDETWKWASSPITFNCLRGGEDYDARREQPGWDQAGFNDTLWRPAMAVPAPRGRLVRAALFPVRRTETVPPVNIHSNRPGVWEIDFGRNLAGWTRLNVRGQAGQRIEVDFPGAESHTHGRYQTDSYILKGGGTEVYEPRFTHHGFNRCVVRGLTTPPTAATVVACNVHSDLPAAGSFACSDERLNRLQAVLRRTCENYNLHFPADPTREKMGWIQDVQNMFATQMLNYDSAAMYRLWLDDLRDAQAASGYEPPVAPNPGIWYDGQWNGVWWGGMMVYLPWELYQFTGDRQILVENYAAMKGWVDWLRTIAGKTNNWCPQDHPLGPGRDPAKMTLDGLVIWGLGDWGEVGTTGYPKRTPVAVTATCGVAYFNRLVSQAATILDRTNEADFYAGEAQRIAAALNRTFLDPATGVYATNSQTAQLLPLVLDVAPPDRRPLIQAQLVANIRQAGNHLTTGFEGTPFLLTGLSDLGLGELAWTLVTQTNAPSWLDIVDNHKSSTFMEFWNAGGVQMPACQGPVGEWFIRDLGGIRVDPVTPGFKHVILRPTPVGRLEWVRATHQSGYGQIISRWQNQAGQFVWDVTIPANTRATLYLPTAHPASVTESGRSAARAEGVRPLPSQDGCAIYEIGSGHYHFAAISAL